MKTVRLGWGFSTRKIAEHTLVNLVERVEPELFKKETEYYRNKYPTMDEEDINYNAMFDIILFSSEIAGAKGSVTSYIHVVANGFFAIANIKQRLEIDDDILYFPHLGFMEGDLEEMKQTQDKYLAILCQAVPELGDELKQNFSPVGSRIYANILHIQEKE